MEVVGPQQAKLMDLSNDSFGGNSGLTIFYCRNSSSRGLEYVYAALSNLLLAIFRRKAESRLIIMDLQSDNDEVLQEFNLQKRLYIPTPVLCGLGDSRVLQTVGESAAFSSALISTLATSSKPRTALQLRDALNQRREEMGAYGYVAELLCPYGQQDLASSMYLYPLLKWRFRRVALAVWATMVLRRAIGLRPPYHRVGVMLFWIRGALSPNGGFQEASVSAQLNPPSRHRMLMI